MKNLLLWVVLCVVLVVPSYGQDRAVPVSIIELIANPAKFDGKLITVRGYLHYQQDHRQVIAVFLYLHQEDSKHALSSNMITISPSEQMNRDREKLDRMYVSISAVFRATKVSGEAGIYTGVLRDVQSCTAWSNPMRPIGQE